jgi:lipopolysaccharide/colanic/teichoic acid biosynthesis glycosyltransferase
LSSILDADARLAWRRCRARMTALRWHVGHRLALGLKRGLDIAGSGILLLLLAPLFGLVALAIKLDSPGPVFFAQVRVGRYGRLFTMWKFRSMHVKAEAHQSTLASRNEMSGGVIFKMKQDPRITRSGRLIRRVSLDELPQLWNVFRGDMSLVGPRPALPREVALYTLSQRQRLEGMPGITCLWQVSGRSELPFETQVTLDVQYVDSWSFWGDVRLLLKTIPAVITGRGAY